MWVPWVLIPWSVQHKNNLPILTSRFLASSNCKQRAMRSHTNEYDFGPELWAVLAELGEQECLPVEQQQQHPYEMVQYIPPILVPVLCRNSSIWARLLASGKDESSTTSAGREIEKRKEGSGLTLLTFAVALLKKAAALIQLMHCSFLSGWG